MSAAPDGLSVAIEWLKTEIPHTPFGRISIGVQIHDGRIMKVFKSIEETTLASQGGQKRSGNGADR